VPVGAEDDVVAAGADVAVGVAIGNVVSTGGAGARTSQNATAMSAATDTAPATSRPAPNHVTQSRARSAMDRGGAGRGTPAPGLVASIGFSSRTGACGALSALGGSRHRTYRRRRPRDASSRAVAGDQVVVTPLESVAPTSLRTAVVA
jgi:pyruvate/2-oxoglutarate dehydrogenase complex dihydrolipoamide acyltransferase (E2) component